MQLGSSLWAILVAGFMILVVTAIATPKLVVSRVGGNEAAAIGTLKTIESYQRLHKEKGHATFANLKELRQTDMKTLFKDGGTRQGYRFACGPSKTRPGESWWATADPVEPGRSGRRSFLLNHTGNIYSSTAPITPNPETCEPPESDQVKRLGG